MIPFISCVCPTYKRPKLLQNALACFLSQDYPSERCELIICDDANQFNEYKKDNWIVISTEKRFSNLPDKFNFLISKAKGDLIAIWEDDDIYLPWHLKDISECFLKNESDFLTSKNAWSTYNLPFGEVQLEDATGRFHSSWRFTKELFEKVNGYPKTNSLSFDQQFGATLRKNADGHSFYGEDLMPSYVYRWGNGYWHGSQRGDGENYQSLWNDLEKLPYEHQGILKPMIDDQTSKIYALFDHE